MEQLILIHYLLHSILQSKLPITKVKKVVDALMVQSSTAGGQTLGSYRIPIAWEHLGLKLALALAQP